MTPSPSGRLLAALCGGLLSALPGWGLDLNDWKIEGDVGIDAGRSRNGSGAALKIGPGGKAVKELRVEDGSGRVTLWVFDDQTAPADAKARRCGPCWGVRQADGQHLVAGALYAGYLAGDEGYSAGTGLRDFYANCQWLSIKREAGTWRQWTFDFDPAKGMTLSIDGKPARFDWNKTTVGGFNAIVILGDEARGDRRQTIWVDDVQTTLGGPMLAKPTPPPTPMPFLPEQDPAATGDPMRPDPRVADKHPRLLVTAESLPRLRAFFASEAAAGYRQELLARLPNCTVPADRKTSPAWGQEFGLQKMPTVALHYLLTGDKQSLARCTAFLQWLAQTANWTDGGEPAVGDTPEAYAQVMERLQKQLPYGERNSDTTAAFTMVGAALIWDWCYNDLDPALRAWFRQVLWQHARMMYHGGHLKGNPGGDYWRGVPMYNHRWFRDWGLTMAVAAVAEGRAEEQWLLGKVRDELQFMSDWLPPDGSIHEGPGYGASSGALGMSFLAFDGCFGTRLFAAPFFRQVAMFAMQESAPGMQEAFYVADCFTKATSIHPFYLKAAASTQNADVLDGIRRHLQVSAKRFGIGDQAWMSLLYDDPEIRDGDFTRLPTTHLFPDLGFAILRESWLPDAVAASFKCGPPGGYTLNAWRQLNKTDKGALPYINVAHDLPDANAFTILGGGEHLAETNRYPTRPGKLSSGHNTILVNQIGQMPEGRGEGSEWLQPSSQDMTRMGVITAWKDAGAVVVVEGEASGSYPAVKSAKIGQSRPALERFRRTFVWVKEGYILVLDDIRSPQPVDITWLMQGQKLEALNADRQCYRLGKNQAHCDFRLLADAEIAPVIGISTANDHGKLLNWQQLQATAAGRTAVRFVSIFDPWHRGDLQVTFTASGAEQAAITVTGKGIDDTWVWSTATERFAAASLHGTRPQGFDVLVDAGSAVMPKEQP